MDMNIATHVGYWQQDVRATPPSKTEFPPGVYNFVICNDNGWIALAQGKKLIIKQHDTIIHEFELEHAGQFCVAILPS